MTLRRLAAGGPVQPIQITAPQSFTLWRLWLQIFVRVCFERFETGFGTEIVGAHLVSKLEIFLAWSYFHQADWIDKDLVRNFRLFHGHTPFVVCCDLIEQGVCHIVVLIFNDLILQVLFVFVLMGSFFLLKRRERSGKNYPISPRKAV